MIIKVTIAHAQEREYEAKKGGKATSIELMGMDASKGDHFTPGMITVALRGEDKEKAKDLSIFIGKTITVVPEYFSVRSTGLSVSGRIIDMPTTQLPTAPKKD